MSKHFPPYNNSREKIKVELDLSNYTTKDDVENITHVDVSSFASKTNLAVLKTEVDKLDTGKLKTTPTHLAKLPNAVDNKLVKKTVYNAKVTAIDSQIGRAKQSATNNLAECMMYVYLSGNYFKQNKVVIPNNNNVINIYYVYELQPIASSRDTSYTIQNALFGAMQITKDPTNNSKNNYRGYGICFDERNNFSHTITQDGRQRTSNGKNVLIFGADMSSSIHATNRANHIYCF